MGSMMGNGMGGNNQMSMLANLLGGGNMNMGNNMGNNMGMGMNNGRNGMMNNMMGMMLQAMMQQHMGGMQGWGDSSESSEGASREDMMKLEAMMKREFAMEVAQFVMVYQEYEMKMKAFKEAMEGLCLGVEASYEYGVRNNIEANTTLEAEVDAIGERIDSLDTKDMKIDALVELIA